MRNFKKPIVTYILIGANVLIFLLLSFNGRTEDAEYMARHGALYVPYLTDYHEYYRMITSLFLHFGFWHLANNMLTLFVLGRFVEPVVGKARFLIIYFTAGIGGNALSMALEMRSGDFTVSAGASGAIFGITGALLALAILNRGQIAGISRFSIILMIAVSLYNGFASSGVNNAAHVGGLICGFLISLIICPRLLRRRRRQAVY